MAREVGFEPTTLGLEDRCSIQLSYSRIFSTKPNWEIKKIRKEPYFRNAKAWEDKIIPNILIILFRLRQYLFIFHKFSSP